MVLDDVASTGSAADFGFIEIAIKYHSLKPKAGHR